ncbi:MAG: ABC transporter permease subunit [Candidatus Omnitrophota bacterium]|nr:ABC transporter permease subunit [Candidatus Omnitrophota bacterium]
MRRALVIARKEATSFFRSWSGTLIFAFFFLIAGIFFSLLLLSYAKLSFEASKTAYQGLEGIGLTRFVFGSFFLNFSMVLIFLVPILSMRTFSEERKTRTLELLFTYPLSDFDIVWGKFLGLVWIMEALLLPTLVYLGLIHWMGLTFDWGPVLMGYLGFWLLANAYLSLGLFVSSLTDSQVTSAMISFACLMVFWMFEWVAGVADGTVGQVFVALSPLSRYRNFTLGILDLSDIVYFCFFHFFFLFLTMRSVETRNWKG